MRELLWLLRDAGCLGKPDDLVLSTLLLSLLPPAYTERLEAARKAAAMYAPSAVVAVEKVAARCDSDVCSDQSDGIEETARASVIAGSPSSHGAMCGQDHVAASLALPKAADTVPGAALDAVEEAEDAICEVKALKIAAWTLNMTAMCE